MDVIPIFAILILSSIIGTFMLAVSSYFIFKIREAKNKAMHNRQIEQDNLKRAAIIEQEMKIKLKEHETYISSIKEQKERRLKHIQKIKWN
jgi:hypothetical protein